LARNVQGSILVLVSKRTTLYEHADEVERPEGTDADGFGYLAKRDVVGPQRKLLIFGKEQRRVEYPLWPPDGVTDDVHKGEPIDECLGFHRPSRS
jgi:hypothetical protein